MAQQSPDPLPYRLSARVNLRHARAAIDHDVAFFKEGQESFDDRVDRTTGFDHNHHAAWPFQLTAKFFQRMRADDRLSVGSSADKVVDFGSRSVVNGHSKIVAGHVEDKIFAHHGEPNQSDICV